MAFLMKNEYDSHHQKRFEYFIEEFYVVNFGQNHNKSVFNNAIHNELHKYSSSWYKLLNNVFQVSFPPYPSAKH